MGSLFLPLIIIFVLILILIINQARLRERITFLEWQVSPLNKLTERLRELEEKLEGLMPLEESGKKKETVEPVAVPAPVIEPAQQVPSVAKPEVQEPREPAMQHKMAKSRTKEEWEAFIGGKLLNRIGSLALIIGLGFFLKYAFDNNWISETVRVLIGAAVGLMCIALAHRTHKKGLQIFAQGLSGAGISILYLSVYASFNFYNLVPQWTAFILMSAVTAVSIAIGLYYNSLAVGLLGWAGGFLTPVMLSTGIVNEAGLFTYIALLDTGLLGVVLAKKEWNIIEPLTFGGTWVLFFSWYFEYYRDTDLTLTVFFISVFWVLFFGLDYARLRTGSDLKSLQHILAGANLVIYFIMLYSLIDKDFHTWTGGTVLLLASVYFGMFLLFQRSGADIGIVNMRHVLSAAALVVAATAIQFEDFTTIMLWSAEIVILAWAGVQWKKRPLYISAAVLFALTVMKFLYTRGAFAYAPIDQFAPFMNVRFLALAVMILTFAATARLLHGAGGEGAGLSPLFHSAWSVSAFILFTVETNDYFNLILEQGTSTVAFIDFLRILVLALVWCALSLPLVWIGLRNRILPVLVSGLFILGLGVLLGIVRGISYVPLDDFNPVLNVRAGALLVSAAFVFIQTSLLANRRDAAPWIGQACNILRVAIVIQVLVLLTGETKDYFTCKILAVDPYSEELEQLKNLRQLSLSGVWLIYSAVLMAYGFWRSHRSFRIIAFVLFGLTIMKIFIYDLSYLGTLYRIFSFVGLGVILIAVSYVYQKYKDLIFGSGKK